ncbi:hypothetical protein U1Q18_050298 [Sarracenia purpurea var. burkii]
MRPRLYINFKLRDRNNRVSGTTARSTGEDGRRLGYGPRFIFSSNGHRENRERQDNEPKPLSWAEYFGLEDVTVTKTAVHSVTAKYYDPNTVVTFNVRGCHPSKLPFNLHFAIITLPPKRPLTAFQRSALCSLIKS